MNVDDKTDLNAQIGGSHLEEKDANEERQDEGQTNVDEQTNLNAQMEGSQLEIKDSVHNEKDEKETTNEKNDERMKIVTEKNDEDMKIMKGNENTDKEMKKVNEYIENSHENGLKKEEVDLALQNIGLQVIKEKQKDDVTIIVTQSENEQIESVEVTDSDSRKSNLEKLEEELCVAR